MKLRIGLPLVFGLLCLTLSSAHAAQLLWDNGLPCNPLICDPFVVWNIADGNKVSNSFTTGGASWIVDRINWFLSPTLPLPPPGTTVEWSFWSNDRGGGMLLGSGTSVISCQVDDIPYCGTTIFPFPLPIPPGLTSVVLQGLSANGALVESLTATNIATFTNADGVTQDIPGEAFQLFGTAVPEPSSILMLGSGMLGLAGVLRRKLDR
jgi:hypothetical protein